MTDTAREAAIERVRAYVEENADKPDEYDTRDGDLLLGDLRLLLTDPRQPSEAPVAADEGWRLIESAPRDGTEFIATVRVFSNNAFSHHDTHIVAVDDETGELANHYEQGWRLEDYEFWRPLPVPPTGEES